MTMTMSGEVDVRVVYSRDQQARAEMQHWEQVAESAPRWRPLHRRNAEMRAEEARDRAVSAGIDWNLVPRPPEGLRAPDRSRRRRGGIDGPLADWRPSPPKQPSGSGPSATLGGLHLTMQLATAPVASAQAAEPKPGDRHSDAPPSGGGATSPPAAPPPPAPPPVAPLPAPPAPVAQPVTSAATAAAPAAATSGGGVGLAYGSADVGSLTAVSAMDWLNTGPQPVYEDPGGGGFLQAPDGGLWYQDAAGQAYGLGPDGAYYALGQDGYLYGQMPDGGYFTWAEDGTQLLPDEQGLLWAYTDDGQAMALGDDGQYYTPDAWAAAAPAWEEQVPPVEPLTEPPPQEEWVDTEFVDYSEQPVVTEPGPTPGLGDLAPDPLWPAENDDAAATFGEGEPSEPLAFGDPFAEPGPLLSESLDDSTAVEPSFEDPLPPPEDPPPLYEDDMSSDEPPAEPPSSGWMDGTLDV